MTLEEQLRAVATEMHDDSFEYAGEKRSLVGIEDVLRIVRERDERILAAMNVGGCDCDTGLTCNVCIIRDEVRGAMR